MDNRRNGVKSGKKRSVSRSSSARGSDDESNAEDQSPKHREHGTAGSPKPARKEGSPTSTKTEEENPDPQPIQIDLDEELLSSEDEGHPLVFDTNVGKLIRSLPAGQSWRAANLEDGQSEEEDGYQVTVADEKAPSKVLPSGRWSRC